MRIRVYLALFLFACLPLNLIAQDDDDQKQIATSERVQVTATRIPEAVEPEPASITIVTGEDLRATGANDLSTALSMVQGVSIAYGGDGGPASYVPELWGLREFDAFLLVVDNVPWGGAFNPALATLDLNDIERIEVMRGAAPVMYGATSFVGVIHVIHRSASSPGNSARASIGNYATGGGAGRFALPSAGDWKHAISFNYDTQGYRDDRTGYDRGHALYRAERPIGAGQFHLDFDLNILKQDPASPHPRAGGTLDPTIPLDANHNPSDAKQDENRFHFVAGYDRQLWGTDWGFRAALTHAERDIIKGFLADLGDGLDAAGYRQNQDQTDLYLDTHFAWRPSQEFRVVTGADYLFGRGEAQSENFDYFVNLDGTNAPNSNDLPIQERPRLEDERNFFGVYGQVEWTPAVRWLVQGGLRFNSTHENREGEVLPGEGGEEPGEEEGGKDSRSDNRLSSVIGVSYLAVSQPRNNIWIFADYRNSFKPAAIDFGPEAEGEILEPETANSYEAGVKGESFDARLDWEFSVFRLDFENLVTSTVENGLPVLINSGTQRFTGAEVGVGVRLPENVGVKFAYSHHSAKFRDFVQEFDGVPTQLAGKKLEMSPDDLFGFGASYTPPSGIQGSLLVNYIGERFLNKRNTALAEAFTTISAGVGYRFGRNTVRLDAENLTNERDPISESELGDAQYYRLPARNFRVGWFFDF
jgi:outer membrane receptor protein involved in Fe transport